MLSEQDFTPETAAMEEQLLPSSLHGCLLEYVDENCYNSALCLTSVADHLNTSIYAVSRAFKDITGIGFKDYITTRRLQHACQLLADTDETISEIAIQSGFENATYFTTVFKHEYGIPPTKYRANASHGNPKTSP